MCIRDSPLERLLEAARDRWHLQFHFHPTFPSSPRISVNASILLGYTEAIRQRLHGFGCWSQPALWLPGNPAVCYRLRRSRVGFDADAYVVLDYFGRFFFAKVAHVFLPSSVGVVIHRHRLDCARAD